MNAFEIYMMDNFILYNFVLASFNLFIIYHISNNLNKGLFNTIIGLAMSIFSSFMTSIVAIFIIAMFIFPNFILGILNDLPGATAWITETGVEFGVITIITGFIGYPIMRFRKIKRHDRL